MADWWTGVGLPERRQALVRVVLVLILAVFAVKLVQVQIINSEALAQEGLDSRMRRITEPAKRGQIVSSDGTLLATDVARYEIQANQLEIAAFTATEEQGGDQGPEAAARLLSQVTGIDQAKLTEQLTGEGRYEQLIKSASQDLWDQIRGLGIAGIYGAKFYQRQYPAGGLAGNVLGYPYRLETDQMGDPTHFTGLELTQDGILSGKPGQKWIEVGAGGQPIPGGHVSQELAQAGCQITTTIDSDLQWNAETAVNQTKERYSAEAVMAVVWDVANGEILALAESDAVDPTDPGKTAAYARGSRAVETVFEPGSTGKVITMAEALEQGDVKPDSPFEVPGEWTIGDQVYKDSSPHGVLQLTLAGILAQSSNVGTIRAASNVADQTRYDYLKAFGWGDKTGIELSTEVSGFVPKPGTESWDGRTRNVILFGQGVSTTAIQATGVFATLGNQGVATTPHLVKGVTCPDQAFQPTIIGQGQQVIKPETARTIIDMMEAAVTEGTGQEAQVEGYRVAGKTGTAEWLLGTDQTKYVGSFVGLAPAEAPRVAIGVFVLDPKGVEYGGVVAAPVFAELAGQALERLGVPPSTEPPVQMPLTY
ncbi:MAG: penicillin-binding protein 2 [Micrococcales bacterium]|nr:penicillin-binding protein 2 [Micrococcales bacterium]